jgi:hypothetical protein
MYKTLITATAIDVGVSSISVHVSHPSGYCTALSGNRGLIPQLPDRLWGPPSLQSYEFRGLLTRG